MDKACFFKSDINERRLHSWKDAIHAPEIDIARNIALLSALNVNLYERFVFEEGNTSLLMGGINNDSLTHEY